jgi:hypothetical protein
MHRDKGFAPLAVFVVLVVLVMVLAQCDARYATGATLTSSTLSGGTP